jgi:hypothetical protein
MNAEFFPLRTQMWELVPDRGLWAIQSRRLSNQKRNNSGRKKLYGTDDEELDRMALMQARTWVDIVRDCPLGK